jgi:hypothetical protein
MTGADMEQVCRLKYYKTTGALFVSGDFDPKTGYDMTEIEFTGIIPAISNTIGAGIYYYKKGSMANVRTSNGQTILSAALAANAKIELTNNTLGLGITNSNNTVLRFPCEVGNSAGNPVAKQASIYIDAGGAIFLSAGPVALTTSDYIWFNVTYQTNPKGI